MDMPEYEIDLLLIFYPTALTCKLMRILAAITIAVSVMNANNRLSIPKTAPAIL